ncbi:Cof-type HAD-IIB family hydrolase [Oecophyllibacter saccharovorans]|uniref:Cof-type HAD-IIB family hydrolase n=1 Tax=Oecophyllibacter saccharovorans TaxID=2558360 RepID=UPI00117220BE|nr:Cof-type HAD-IIB family hydrolase [Oecophyllibacter saccharovorans]TPW36562.1 HAD family phosphatase [Oecophyllibacter saccharovorans]
MTRATETSPAQAPIRLVVTDVDGTLLDPDRQLTPQTIAAAHKLQQAGVGLALCSARAPGALLRIMEALQITGPCAAFNGGALFQADGVVDKNLFLQPEVTRLLINALESEPVETWLQNDTQWLVRDAQTPLVRQEAESSGLVPTQVANLADHVEGINRVVAMGVEAPVVASLDGWLVGQFGGFAAIARSMPCRINITAPDANKGNALADLARLYGVPLSEVAALGDAPNDIGMLREAGLGIAMGQSPESVKAYAQAVTGSNAQNGWAEAVEKFIMPRVQAG